MRNLPTLSITGLASSPKEPPRFAMTIEPPRPTTEAPPDLVEFLNTCLLFANTLTSFLLRITLSSPIRAFVLLLVVVISTDAPIEPSATVAVMR